MSILDNVALNKAAKAKAKAESNYEKAWRRARTDTPRLDVDRFWDIMEYFREKVLYDRYDASKYATDELFRRCICDQLEVNGTKVTFDELVMFLENYNAVEAALRDALWEVVTDKSDDSYGDLCDSLPIVGREGVAKLLSASPDFGHDNNTVISVIDESCPKDFDPAKWRKFIWDGENYFEMMFEEAAQTRYVHEARDHKPREESLV